MASTFALLSNLRCLRPPVGNHSKTCQWALNNSLCNKRSGETSIPRGPKKSSSYVKTQSAQHFAHTWLTSGPFSGSVRRAIARLSWSFFKANCFSAASCSVWAAASSWLSLLWQSASASSLAICSASYPCLSSLSCKIQNGQCAFRLTHEQHELRRFLHSRGKNTEKIQDVVCCLVVNNQWIQKHQWGCHLEGMGFTTTFIAFLQGMWLYNEWESSFPMNICHKMNASQRSSSLRRDHDGNLQTWYAWSPICWCAATASCSSKRWK